MRLLITGLLALAVSVMIALALKQDNGYVLVAYDRWTLEGSLALFLLLILVLFSSLYLLLRVWLRVWHSPRKLRDWQGHRAVRRARKNLTQGLLELSEGHWQRAEKNLMRHIGESETPLFNYLAAARCAQQQGANQRRDHYLELARQGTPSADLAVGITQAELQLAHGQLEQALATLQRLRDLAPGNRLVLKLRQELYEKTGNWDELRQLLPELKRQELVDQGELARLELQVFCKQLDRAAANEDPDRLTAAWKALPVNAKAAEPLLLRYAHHLLDRGETGLVEVMLRRALDSSWSDNLAELYGRLETESGAQRLAIAESWLKQHPGNPMLLLMLGRLSLKERLWGKARSYLEASIGAGPTPQAYQELGVLLEKMDESEQAMECFRTGLDLSSRLLSEGTGIDLDPAAPNVHSALPGPPPDLDRSRLALAHEDDRGR